MALPMYIFIKELMAQSTFLRTFFLSFHLGFIHTNHLCCVEESNETYIQT